MTEKKETPMKRRKVIRKSFKPVRVIKGRKPRKKRRKLHAYMIWILTFTLIFLCYRYVEYEMIPTVTAISNMRIQTVSNDIISQAIDDTLMEKNINTEDLSTYYFNDQNEMISFGVNTVLVNEISSSVMSKISEQIKAYQGDVLYIPLGRLTGSSIFSNVGPRIKVKIMPYGTISINYDSAFVSQGINQINHRIWLAIEMKIQVVAPLNSKALMVKQSITLVDRVITGHVPDSYIQVPKDEVLNVVN